MGHLKASDKLVKGDRHDGDDEEQGEGEQTEEHATPLLVVDGSQLLQLLVVKHLLIDTVHIMGQVSQGVVDHVRQVAGGRGEAVLGPHRPVTPGPSMQLERGRGHFVF